MISGLFLNVFTNLCGTESGQVFSWFFFFFAFLHVYSRSIAIKIKECHSSPAPGRGELERLSV